MRLALALAALTCSAAKQRELVEARWRPPPPPPPPPAQGPSPTAAATKRTPEEAARDEVDEWFGHPWLGDVYVQNFVPWMEEQGYDGYAAEKQFKRLAKGGYKLHIDPDRPHSPPMATEPHTLA